MTDWNKDLSSFVGQTLAFVRAGAHRTSADSSRSAMKSQSGLPGSGFSKGERPTPAGLAKARALIARKLNSRRFRHHGPNGYSVAEQGRSGLKPQRAAPARSNQHNPKADRKGIDHKVFEPGMTGWKRDLHAFQYQRVGRSGQQQP